MASKNAFDLNLTIDQINEAAKRGRAFIDSRYGNCYISEYTRAGLVTFTETGFKSTYPYGTARIQIVVD